MDELTNAPCGYPPEYMIFQAVAENLSLGRAAHEGQGWPSAAMPRMAKSGQ